VSEPPIPGGSKLVSLDEAVAGVADGSTVMIGGWGDCGTPHRLVAALVDSGASDLVVVITGSAPADPLFESDRVARLVTSFGSYPGAAATGRAFERRVAAGMEVELCSQGVLAERIRAGGAGIPAFYIEEQMVGPFRSTDEVRIIDGRPCVLETALRADVALIGASVADPLGNLAWRDGERNFNDPMAYAADLVVAEAFEMYEVGWLPPEHVMVPGLVVDRVLPPG
jgi:3-oxoacid CoA-transferase A subunit